MSKGPGDNGKLMLKRSYQSDGMKHCEHSQYVNIKRRAGTYRDECIKPSQGLGICLRQALHTGVRGIATSETWLTEIWKLR